MQIYVTQLLMHQRGINSILSCLIKLIFHHFRPSTVHDVMSCELNLPFLSSFPTGEGGFTELIKLVLGP